MFVGHTEPETERDDSPAPRNLGRPGRFVGFPDEYDIVAADGVIQNPPGDWEEARREAGHDPDLVVTRDTPAH